MNDYSLTKRKYLYAVVPLLVTVYVVPSALASIRDEVPTTIGMTYPLLNIAIYTTLVFSAEYWQKIRASVPVNVSVPPFWVMAPEDIFTPPSLFVKSSFRAKLELNHGQQYQPRRVC